MTEVAPSAGDDEGLSAGLTSLDAAVSAGDERRGDSTIGDLQEAADLLQADHTEAAKCRNTLPLSSLLYNI
jgi:alpha-D-ribose 1-methylphosphonate 5-triphosphate diphosphatase PhnM